MRQTDSARARGAHAQPFLVVFTAAVCVSLLAATRTEAAEVRDRPSSSGNSDKSAFTPVPLPTFPRLQPTSTPAVPTSTTEIPEAGPTFAPLPTLPPLEPTPTAPENHTSTASPTSTAVPSTPAPSTSTPATPTPPTRVPPTPQPADSSSSSSSGFHKFTLINLGIEQLWPAVLGNPGFPVIENGGFILPPASPPFVLHIPVGWQGRIWARVGCNFTNNGTCDPPFAPCCASGSCLQADGTFGMYCADSGIAPTSLIEFSLDNPSPYGPYDVYDISLVDGWSVPLSIEPVNGTFNPHPDPGVAAPWCEFTGCYAAPPCPPLLAVNGTTTSCWSPCQAAVNVQASHHFIDRACCVCTQSHPDCNCLTSTDPSNSHYGCCNGGFGCTPFHTPSYPQDTVCNPWSNVSGRGWTPGELQYIEVVESVCRKVYSWQFDDRAATFMCRKTDGVVEYDVKFLTLLR